MYYYNRSLVSSVCVMSNAMPCLVTGTLYDVVTSQDNARREDEVGIMTDERGMNDSIESSISRRSASILAGGQSN